MLLRLFLLLLAVLATVACDGGSSSPEVDGGQPPMAPDCGPAVLRDGGVPECPAPPACASDEARTAIDVENGYRVGMGIECATMVESINTAAENHCVYHVNATPSCLSPQGPYVEVLGCRFFTGIEFNHRMAAAGYPGSPIFESMTFVGDGYQAMEELVHSVWDRTPVLSPWIRDMGYGTSGACDTVDFGVGRSTPDDVVATFPYDGQLGVPASYDGSMEGPEPPIPSGGWPAGYPISIYAKDATITTHTLTLDGDTDPIPHVWMVPGGPDDPFNFLLYTHVLYAESPLAAATTYRVQVQGTYIGGPLDLDFTFTTE